MEDQEYEAIQEYLGKNKKDIYLYTGKFAPDYIRNQKVKILNFFPNDGSTCEAFIQLYGGEGGQCENIPREEVKNNLIII